MREIWKNKKVRIGILGICILILIGLIIGIVLNGDKDKIGTGKENSGQDIIVHEADKDTVEEKAEDGLKESDSEDGPILNEDNMIDFNGSDASDSSEDEESSDEDSSEDEESNDEDSSEDDKKEEGEDGETDTGSWGIFY